MYLSRGPRNRLQAEFIRDLVLASSGFLVRTIGGPSMKPYQPQGLWETATSGRGVLATYSQDHHDSLYRRGMYTFIKLTVPPPSMAMFDASNRDQCEVRRSENQYAAAGADHDERSDRVGGFARPGKKYLLTQNAEPRSNHHGIPADRLPETDSQRVKSVLTDYYNNQLRSFQQKKFDAAKTLNIGEYPSKIKRPTSTHRRH